VPPSCAPRAWHVSTSSADDLTRRDAIKVAIGAGVAGMVGAAPRIGAGPVPPDNAVRAAEALVRRVLPTHRTSFAFERLDATGPVDTFQLTSRGDQIVIGGTTAGAMAAGLHHYLTTYCHAAIAIDNRQLHMPSRLPAVRGAVRMSSAYQYRYLFNYCTYGYSMPWWNWAQWEHMIDTMALQGVNLPLAPIGQEAVWQQVYTDLGLSRAELDAFFVGPAHLPWGRMGNIDGLGGPLPQRWIDQQRRLQEKILARMRSLGMTPVLQGFTGHVPPTLQRHFPTAPITQLGAWAGIPGTQFLDPASDLFREIGRRFIQTQTAFYGTDHYYDADCFIEVDPPSRDPAYLSALSRGVFESMVAADPDAIWVLQGWFFFFRKDFWQSEQGRAFVGGVPDDRMIVLDLYGERNPTWKATESFYGKRWIWNVICNQDQQVNMSGDLARMQANLAEARSAPGRLSGIGVIPEGVGYNPVVHEFVFSKAWQPDDVNVATWVRGFARRRYGRQDRGAEQAWELLLATVYGRSRVMDVPLLSPPHLIAEANATHTATPATPAWDFDSALLTDAAAQLLASSGALQQSAAYRFDLVNVHRELLQSLSSAMIRDVSAAYVARDAHALDRSGARLLALLDDLDTLCGSDPNFLLGRWIRDARSWSATPAEADYYERNARTIVSIWMPWKTGGLRDYAAKAWNGMFRTYYRPRWALLITHLQQSLRAGSPFDPAAYDAALRDLDFAWTLNRSRHPTEPTTDPVRTSRAMLAKYETRLRALGR
jgi:alpha-N-acetylglucosaminidase